MGYTFGGLTSGISVGKGSLVYSDQYIIPVRKQYFEVRCYSISKASILTAFSINYGIPPSDSNVYKLIIIGYLTGFDDITVINNKYGEVISISTPRYIGIAIDFDNCYILEILDSISDIHYDHIPRVDHTKCRFLFHDYLFNKDTRHGTTV